MLNNNNEMVLIPAGPFLYGSKEDDKKAYQDEKPQRVIELPAFYIDIYPVTNEQYCRFLNEKKPDKNDLKKWIKLGGSYKKEKCRIIQDGKSYMVEKGFEKYPVIYVTWYGATAYAEWAGKRLPTEEEWEKAARGTEGRKYPWGDEWQPGLCNSEESGIGMTSEVGKYSGGKSIFGCYDMAGNVWEWTASDYKERPGWYVLRGGAWYFNGNFCRCAYRDCSFPRNRFDDAGFRCARI